jgi:hypothetical protein
MRNSRETSNGPNGREKDIVVPTPRLRVKMFRVKRETITAKWKVN